MLSIEELFTQNLSLIDQKVYQKLSTAYIKLYAKMSLPAEEKERLLLVFNDFRMSILQHLDSIEI